MVPRVPRALEAAAAWSWRLLVITASAVLIVYVLVRLRVVVVPVLLALFLASVLAPPTRMLSERGMPRGLAAATSILANLALIAGAIAFVAPEVAGQFGNIGNQAQRGAEDLISRAAEAVGASDAEVRQTLQRGIDELRDRSDTLASGVLSGALLVGEILASALLALVLLLFFLKDGPQLWGWVLRLVGSPQRELLDDVGRSAFEVLGSYLRGIAVVALFDAVMIGIALAIIGVPLVLPLALLMFFSAFFPIVGAFVAGIIAGLVAFVSEGVIAMLLVGAVIVVVQQLEGNVLHPLVVGRALRLHPAVILVGVTGGAVVAGVLGAFLAVPLIAVVASSVQIAARHAHEPGAPARHAIAEGVPADVTADVPSART